MAGGGAIGLGLDVADAASVREAVGDVVAELGGIDVLVNNAGALRRPAARRRSTSSTRTSGTA